MTYGRPPKGPQQPQLRRFFEEYVKCGSVRAAAKAVGYSEGWCKRHSTKAMKRHHEYCQWLQAHYAQEVVKLIAVDQDVILQELARVGLANEFDYLVFEQKEQAPPAAKEKEPVAAPVMVTVVRRKRLEELTREQMTAIRVFKATDGALDYTMRDRDGKLSELAKHVGLLNEKIILERRNLHLHAAYDLSGVPIEELEAIEGEFEVILERHNALEKVAAK